MKVIIGLDLATHKYGICKRFEGEESDPLEWLRSRTVLLQLDAAKGDLANRIISIRDTVLLEVEAAMSGGHSVVVGAEALPTRGAYGIGMLGELRGVVRVALLERLGIVLADVRLSSLRQTLLGKHASKGSKKLAIATVRSFPGWGSIGEDAADAFAVANHLCSEHGLPFVSVGGREEGVPRRKKTGGRKAPAGVPG